MLEASVRETGVMGSEAGGYGEGTCGKWRALGVREEGNSAGQIISLRFPPAPRMATSPESLFSSGGDLDSSQLQMESDEVDTLREGEDPGTQGVGRSGRGGGGG